MTIPSMKKTQKISENFQKKQNKCFCYLFSTGIKSVFLYLFPPTPYYWWKPKILYFYAQKISYILKQKPNLVYSHSILCLPAKPNFFVLLQKDKNFGKISILFTSILMLFVFFFRNVFIFFMIIFTPFVFFFFRKTIIYIACILTFFIFLFATKLIFYKNLFVSFASILTLSAFFFFRKIFCLLI